MELDMTGCTGPRNEEEVRVEVKKERERGMRSVRPDLD